jgi:hypothetical protein
LQSSPQNAVLCHGLDFVSLWKRGLTITNGAITSDFQGRMLSYAVFTTISIGVVRLAGLGVLVLGQGLVDTAPHSRWPSHSQQTLIGYVKFINILATAYLGRSPDLREPPSIRILTVAPLPLAPRRPLVFPYLRYGASPTRLFCPPLIEGRPLTGATRKSHICGPDKIPNA